MSHLGDFEHSQAVNVPGKEPWGERRSRRDLRHLLGTASNAGELYGQRALWIGLVVLAIMTAVVNILDVISTAHMRPEIGILAPVVWEATAGVAIPLAALIPWALLKYAAIDRRPLWQAVLVTLLCAPVFSVVHVLSFTVLRMALYVACGLTYRLGPVIPGFEYEASRDIFGYLGSFAVFWVAARYVRNQQRVAVSGPRFFDVRDGARLVRAPLNEILAIKSAGNYVEFVLRDGRRPLMRKPLASLEAELAADGFVRTHRFWLVNATQVTGLKPEGSGDYQVQVGSISVPLSRRFPETLAKLRTG